ncbi:MAG: hypothetical protein LBN25_03740 [Christensenellaceae bacterium]|nr:hypothetical protein [Christensenellaceae bacterium]
MQTPLNNAINAHKNHISFHTPGLPAGVFTNDITELSFSDNALFPTGVIAASLEEIRSVAGAENARFVTNGATIAVHTALFAVKDKTVLICGRCHASVFNAVRLYNIKAFYTNDIENSSETAEKIGAEAVIYTSVDYFGNITNLPHIDENIIVIADESHGAHFPFSEKLKKLSALRRADIVIHSCHKTLPVLTGGALLFYNDRVKTAVETAFPLIHSTSPSYLIMSQIEAAYADLSGKNASLYDKIMFETIADNLTEYGFIKSNALCTSRDFTRLVFEFEVPETVNSGLENVNIYPECVVDNKIIFIVTPYNLAQLPKLLSILKGGKLVQKAQIEGTPSATIPITESANISAFLCKGCAAIYKNF